MYTRSRTVSEQSSSSHSSGLNGGMNRNTFSENGPMPYIKDFPDFVDFCLLLSSILPTELAP